MYDVHDYEQNPETFREHYEPLCRGEAPWFNEIGGNVPYDGKLPFFVSEFGGAFFDMDAVVENSGQESGGAWGYGDAPRTTAEFCDRFAALTGVLLDNPEICAFCYTQFTDVEQEMNGIFAYDRRAKFDVDALRAAIARPAAIEMQEN